MTSALQRHPVDVVCPLGSTGDSSALLYYLMNDLPPDLRRPVLPLELALEHNDLDHILLWDDFCGAGGHTITALSQWLGLVDEQVLEERLVDTLTSSRRNRFDQTMVSISFGLGMRQGLSSVQNFLLRHELTTLEIIEPETIVSKNDGVFTKDGLFRAPEERDDFRLFLAEKARGVLAEYMIRSERPWNKEKLDARLLGYGNTAQLLVFYYNVPTVTLTCFWASGDASGWIPLFPRRSKPSVPLSPSLTK